MMHQRRNILLKLPSILYGWGVGIRNMAFDAGLLRSEDPPIPTICVGNISVGGSGKSPHTEMLVRHLKNRYKICVLSRGYGRVGSKPRVVKVDDDVKLVGDEPLQIKSKFPDVIVYVDGNRLRAMKRLSSLATEKRPELVIMDDGFQHRYIKPSHSIILTPYECPFTRDKLLPYGNLRESSSARYRANSVIISKCPKNIKPIDKQLLEGELELHAHQNLYYSSMQNLHPQLICNEEFQNTDIKKVQEANCIVLAGVAYPNPFFAHCKESGFRICKQLVYSDHHNFSNEDVKYLRSLLESEEKNVLITTEKDALRLRSIIYTWPESLRHRCYYISVQVIMNPEKLSLLMENLEKSISTAKYNLRCKK